MSVATIAETITRGRTAALSVTIGSLGASGLDAYSDIRFTAKRDLADDDSAAIITKSSLTSGVDITTVGDATTNGVVTISIDPADTTALPGGYTVLLYCDVTVYDSAGDSWPVASGTITVSPTATQATS